MALEVVGGGGLVGQTTLLNTQNEAFLHYFALLKLQVYIKSF